MVAPVLAWLIPGAGHMIQKRWIRGALLLLSVVGLAVVSTRAGVGWVGRPFPGFFLLRNRVVASVGLSGWPVSPFPEVFQATVVSN